MKQIGVYTGRIYDPKHFDDKLIYECCVPISRDEAIDKDHIKALYAKEHARCLECSGCLEKQRHGV